MTTPKLSWDIGTAYDFFVSLHTLHNPGDFGLRASWAVGVRSRLPQESRDFLQEAMEFFGWPLEWIGRLPAPKDGATVLDALARIPAGERLARLSMIEHDTEDPLDRRLIQIAAAGEATPEDEADLFAIIAGRYGEEKARGMRQGMALSLRWWARSELFGQRLLTALEAYYDTFFAEDEIRLRPALEAALENAQKLASSLPILELLQELSQGVHLLELPPTAELVLAPSYWGSPLLLLGPPSPNCQTILFGGRPADASIVPGEVIPDTLYQSLKALADPTRLRILRYLMEESLTPSELAGRLRLRPPTVVHHLQTLRLARLVTVDYEEEGKRYRARYAAVREMNRLLDRFLGAGVRESTRFS